MLIPCNREDRLSPARPPTDCTLVKQLGPPKRMKMSCGTPVSAAEHRGSGAENHSRGRWPRFCGYLPPVATANSRRLGRAPRIQWHFRGSVHGREGGPPKHLKNKAGSSGAQRRTCFFRALATASRTPQTCFSREPAGPRHARRSRAGVGSEAIYPRQPLPDLRSIALPSRALGPDRQ